MFNRFARFIARKYVHHMFGSRCKEYDLNCGCCAAWQCFEYLYGDWVLKDHTETEFKKVKIIVTKRGE